VLNPGSEVVSSKLSIWPNTKPLKKASISPLNALPMVVVSALLASCSGLFPLSRDADGIPGIREVVLKPGTDTQARRYMKDHGLKVLADGSVMIHHRWFNKIDIEVPPFNVSEIIVPLRHQPFVKRIDAAYGALDSIELTEAVLSRSSIFGNAQTAQEYDAAGKQALGNWLAQWIRSRPKVRFSAPLVNNGNSRYTFQLLGPSDLLSEREPGHWEQLTFFVIIFPSFTDPKDVVASFQVEGKMAKWPQSSVPPEEAFRTDPFPKLGDFVNQLKDDIQKTYAK
jgi:hypothetical protein